MSVNIQHKLLHHEMPPPPGTWDNIARRLDEEFDTAEVIVSQKILDATLEPPAFAWQAITARLDDTVAPEKPAAKVVPIFQRRSIAIAAALTGLLILGAWFFRQYNFSGAEVAVTPGNKEIPVNTKDIPEAGPLNTDEINSAVAQIIPRRVRVSDMNRRTYVRHVSYTPEMSSNETYDIPEPRTVLAQPLHVADATGEAAVSAPLLRDGNGNIIMDMSLLTSASSGNYITVTGPNGEQTRISSKFANFLAYLNNSSSDKEEYLDYLIRNSGAWKKRFDEWRNKILQQANFSPSGATFFDILELKELIKEQ